MANIIQLYPYNDKLGVKFVYKYIIYFKIKYYCCLIRHKTT